jgi:uncharacterized glyoxalase superfamily protein PhnB
MYQRIAHYDKAITCYRDMLDFIVVEDTQIGEKQWVLISPPGAKETCLVLVKAINEAQTARIGDQTGGRVFLFLYTDDFHLDYQKFMQRGVKFIRPPQDLLYGTGAVFQDLYGNLWDLIQPNEKNKGLLNPSNANVH